MTDSGLMQMIDEAIAEIDHKETLKALAEAGLDWRTSATVAWIDNLIAGLTD